MTDEEAPGFSRLPAGVTPEQILDAVRKSGYPLQNSVADTLGEILLRENPHSVLQEEWAFIDNESGQTRSIDIFAETTLGKADRGKKVRVAINLLVECKQSELPYIFFTRLNAPEKHYTFPEIAGLTSTDLEIFVEKDGKLTGGSYFMSLHDAFSFYDEPFFNNPAHFALSLSKATRKSGNKIELTGEDAYRSITLPLTKAADHLIDRCTPNPGASTFACRFVICLAVLRAPMFSVTRLGKEDLLMETSWVRGCRLEPPRNIKPGQPISTVRYFDVVHEDHLPTYLDQLLNSTKRIAARIASRDQAVAIGRVTHGRGAEPWTNMKPVTDDVKRSEKQLQHRGRIALVRDRLEFIPDQRDSDSDSSQNDAPESQNTDAR